MPCKDLLQMNKLETGLLTDKSWFCSVENRRFWMRFKVALLSLNTAIFVKWVIPYDLPGLSDLSIVLTLTQDSLKLISKTHGRLFELLL